MTDNPHGATPQVPFPVSSPVGGQAGVPHPYAGQAPGFLQPGSLEYVERHFGEVAQFGDRVLPHLVDYCLGLVSYIPMTAGMIVLMGSLASGVDGQGAPVPASSAGLVAGVLLVFLGFVGGFALQLWNQVVREGKTGQSLGKTMFGLVLVDAVTGRPIGAGKALLRLLVNGATSLLGALWMLWDPNRLTLGDLAVGSTVIKVPRQ